MADRVDIRSLSGYERDAVAPVLRNYQVAQARLAAARGALQAAEHAARMAVAAVESAVALMGGEDHHDARLDPETWTLYREWEAEPGAPVEAG